MACLVVAQVSGQERDLGVTSGPPGFYSLKNAFFVRHERG